MGTQRAIQSEFRYALGNAGDWTTQTGGSGVVTENAGADGWNLDSGPAIDGRAFVTTTLTEALDADQWYFLGVEASNYTGAAAVNTSYRLSVAPEEGTVNHVITSDGYRGITFKYDGPQTPQLWVGISPLQGSGETINVSYDIGIPVLCKVTGEEGAPCEPTTPEWVSGFAFENGNSFNASTGVATLAQGTAIDVTNPQSVMFNADSFGSIQSANSYPNLFQDRNPLVQVIPNATPAQTIATWVPLWTNIENLSNVMHNINATDYRVNFFTPIVDHNAAVLDYGKNDIYGGALAVDVMVNVEAAVANYKAANFGTLIICDCPPHGTAGTAPQNTQRDLFNSLIDDLVARDNQLKKFPMYDTLVDPGDPDKGDAALTNADLFHPSTLGMTAIMDLMEPIIINALSVASPTLITPYSNVSAEVGDSYGPVDYTSNTSVATGYRLGGFPDGIDVSDPAAVAGTFLRYGNSYPGVDAFNEFGSAPQNHFQFDITQEFTVSTSGVLDTSIETPQGIVKPDGHSIFGSGFAHNFVGVTYYSDSAGLIPVDQTAVTGTVVVTVATVETPAEQDAIATEGATGKRWSFSGNPTKGQITFTTIANGAFARVRTRQNKT